MTRNLNTIHFAGIRPDSLGHYLIGLGLLAATSSKWPEIRGCWKDGYYVLLGQDLDRSAVEDFLLEEWQPTEYERWWKDAQQQGPKSERNLRIWRERSKQEIGKVRLLDSHIVGSGRYPFNPVFGTGGNIGRRDLARVFGAARKLLNRKDSDSRSWLYTTLYGVSRSPLPRLTSAGTWFVYANKTYNSGQSWAREGDLSPWSYLLSLEGVQLLTGGVGRRLGSHARPYVLFPFVSDAPSPRSIDEVGVVEAEFWAPLWEYPANLVEIRTLLKRGLARVGVHAAQTPHEFAVAALAAGADAGISAFARFMLRQTNAAQYYEAIPREKVTVNQARSYESDLLTPLLSWLKRLPPEPDNSRRKGHFKGLRGPVEEALIRIAEQPEFPEQWQNLLLLLADIQTRVDRNKDLRGKCQALPRLAPAWLERAWPSPLPELEVARAIASVGAGTYDPVLINIYGIETDKRGNTYFASEGRHPRAVWHEGEPLRVLADVLERRLVDADASAMLPLAGAWPCSAELVMAFLTGTLDLDIMTRWIPPLSLIEWQTNQHRREHSAKRPPFLFPHDGTYLLHALFRPLFHPFPLSVRGSAVFPDDLMPRAMTVRRLFHLIRQEAWDEAFQLARGRYLASGHAIMDPPLDIQANGERIAATLLIPMRAYDVVAGFRRWLQPERR